MHPAFLRAAGFKSLIHAKDHGLPYRFDRIFSDASWGKRRASRRKFQLLRRIDNRLRAMLHPGEEVHSLTRGLCFGFWESYFLGWVLYLFNLRAIVLTDRRIILLQIDRRGRPKKLRSQIRYPTIAKARWAFLSGTKVTFRNGGALYLSGIPRRDRKLIRGLIDRLQAIDMAEAARTGGKEELCPYCDAVVALGMARCDRCAGAFKSAKRAGLLSLLLPGLGDYYMGHRALAVAEMLVALSVWVVVFLPEAAFPMTPGPALILSLIILVLVHVPDGAITWYLARLGVYPAADAASDRMMPGRIRPPPGQPSGSSRLGSPAGR